MENGGSYLDIANSPGMWVACCAIIVVVLAQVIRLIVISFKAGAEIGLTRGQMLTAVRSGFTTALVPSIAILLGLAILMTQLGAPFPWMRLSVIGSVTYELMAAGLASKALGLVDFYSTFDEQVFTNVVWTMSLGVIVGLFIVALFTPRIKWLKDKVAGGDEGWMKVMTAAAFFGAVGYMVADPALKGGSNLVALLAGFLCMGLLGVIITAGKQNWLKEWALALAIIGGMAAAGLMFHFFGIGGIENVVK